MTKRHAFMSDSVLNRASVALGDDNKTVTIKLGGSTRPIIAQALGVKRDGNGKPARIVLDRLIHGGCDENWGDWRVHGAFVSVLEAAGRHS